jgi:hypothetical protein
VAECLQQPHTVKLVRFVLFDWQSHAAYKNSAEKLLLQMSA